MEVSQMVQAGPAIDGLVTMLFALIVFAIWITVFVCIIVIAVNMARIAGTLNRIEKKLGDRDCELKEMEQK